MYHNISSSYHIRNKENNVQCSMNINCPPHYVSVDNGSAIITWPCISYHYLYGCVDRVNVYNAIGA